MSDEPKLYFEAMDINADSVYRVILVLSASRSDAMISGDVETTVRLTHVIAMLGKMAEFIWPVKWKELTRVRDVDGEDKTRKV